MQLIRRVHVPAFTLIQSTPSGDLIVLGSGQPSLLSHAHRETEVLVELELQYGNGGGIVRIEQAKSDTLLITDRRSNRLDLWLPGKGIASQLEIPPSTSVEDTRVLRWPERIAALAFRRGRRELLLLRRNGSRLVVDANIPLDTRFDLSDPNTIALGNAHANGLWLAESRSGLLSRLSVDGTIETTIDAGANWIGNYEFPAAPDPYVAELYQDTEGMLWLYWRVPHAGTGPALIQASRGIRHDRRDLFDTVVEKMDPASGRIVARGYVDAYVVAVFGDGRAAFYHHRGEDGGMVAVYRLGTHRDQ